LRRPFLSERYFFITVRLLRRRVKMTEGDFALLAQAFNRARAGHRLLLTRWVFLPDHGHAICAPAGGADIAFYVCDPFLRVAAPDYPCSGWLVHCRN
jgi:REP element-mobilizing transposase RayT